MITREDYLMVTERRRQGVYIKDIAAEPRALPRTVRRALESGGEPRRRSKRRRSKLNPFTLQVAAERKDL